ncbi:hypothetical protein ACO0K3_09955 [Undibacterium sp. Rencai35W]|uniref:hypothetical protein n=1 Tax=Undibacterium sp. Rencai35W TaxID=3413046 RepID=UPI003BF251AF
MNKVHIKTEATHYIKPAPKLIELSEHHQAAARFHEHASRYHLEAAKHYESGQFEAATFHAHIAHGHALDALQQSDEAARIHARTLTPSHLPTEKNTST